jgi:hypothetical protein
MLDIPFESLKTWILDIEDNITKSDLTYEEQIPLLLATQVGNTDYDYWISKLNVPGSWAPYIPTSAALKTSPLLVYWVIASIVGTLVTANLSARYGLIDSNSRPAVGIDIASALAGSIGVAAGKVIFDYIPRIQNNIYAKSGIAPAYSNVQ